MSSNNKKQSPRMAALAAALSLAWLPQAQAQSYAPWLTQIGINATTSAAGRWGQDQLIGIVDTGIVATHRQFATGQVSTTLSACAAVTFRCSNGVTDDNGHGTAVASIAAGNTRWGSTNSYGGYTVTPNTIIGAASNANIVAQKVLNASGSGYSSDVANGIIRAANAGATVINLSLTYMNSSDIVSAINYAAGKGAFLVWAGGNSSANLLNGASTAGLTQAARDRLVFAGSVNSASQVSSFSNRPGTGGFAGTTTTYASRWLVAPGENIIAPGVQYGANSYLYWSGTSMAAPLVSGSIALLQSAWPILRTRGTTVNLMLATATDLGTRGVDVTYGAGMVNLAQAFQPYGTLTVNAANGSSIALGSLTGSMISSGALGSLGAVRSLLANYTAFDGYARNFSVNLSSLIVSPSGRASVNALPAYANAGPTRIRLADGGEMAYAFEPAPAAAAGLDSVTGMAAQSLAQQEGRKPGYMMLTDRLGNTSAMGYGVAPTYAFSYALSGDHAAARASEQMGVLGLSSLAQGGAMFAWGGRLDDDTRFAASYSQATPFAKFNPMQFVQAWSNTEATTVTLGLSRRLASDFTATVSTSVLEERHGLMGATYDPNALLAVGRRNRSTGFGVGATWNLSPTTLLQAESQWVSTQDSPGSGLIGATTGVRARAAAVSLAEKSLWRDGDRLSGLVRQPLRVVGGEAQVMMAGVDADGLPVMRTEKASLVPDGRQTDYVLSYDTPWGRDRSVSLQVTARRDYLNLPGNHDAGVGMMVRAKF